MTYDELEEQFYIVTQRNKELEKENNALILRNTELEAKNIVFENDLIRSNSVKEHLAKEVEEASLARINLKVKLESVEKKLEEKVSNDSYPLIRSALEQDAEVLQKYRNIKDFSHLPSNSIHRPMQMISSPHQSIVLSVSDEMGMYKALDPMNPFPQLHAYAKMGDKMVRYSSGPLYTLKRREDFAVVLNQMTEGLREIIVNEYVHNHTF